MTLEQLIKLAQVNKGGDYEGVAQEAFRTAAAPKMADIADQKAQAEQARQMQALEDLRKLNPDAQSYKAGDLAVSQGSKMDSVLDMMRYQALQDQRQENKIESLSKFYDKTGLPELESTFEKSAAGLTPEAIKQAYGGGKGIVPNKLMEFFDKEGASTRQKMEALKSFVRHPLFGATLTGQERAAFEEGFGGGFLKRPEALQEAIDRMKSILESQKKNVTAGYKPEVVKEWEQRRGKFSAPQTSTQQPMPQAPESTGPHGPYVIQDGIRYNWNPKTQNYEE